MDAHQSPTKVATITDPSPRNDRERDTGDRAGLRSLRGIRWLLLAGALVSAVSLYRLVESQWELIPLAAQYLVLVFGALGLYFTGEFTHRRLHLPLAGSALMLLFTALVPVLSWGVVYLDLLARPFGWMAFILGTWALLITARRPLRLMLGYRGWIYPAILAIFMVAQPLLPVLVARNPDRGTAITIGAAVLLGILLQIGSRHINRFFFHRDRRDGIDRPVQWMPFALLGILYLGALALFDPRSQLIALPLAVIGAVLADTGEEYYRVLERARGEKPERWPGRSVALMTIGIAAMVVAFPLSFRDPSLVCSALVSLVAAFFFGRWSLRSPGLPTHLAAIGSVFAAYHLCPALVPGLAKQLWARLLLALDLSQGSPLALSIADLGFLLILVGWSGLLRRRGASAALRSVHAGLCVAYLWWLCTLAILDPADPSLFLAVLSFVGIVALVVSRGRELVIGVYGALALLVLAVARNMLGTEQLLDGENLCVLGVLALVATLVLRWVEDPLARLVGSDRVQARRFLQLPATMVAVLIAGHSVVVDLLRTDLGTLELLLAGALLFSSGLIMRIGWLPAVGGLLATTGLHLMVFETAGAVTPALVLMTQLLAGFSLWAAVSLACRSGSLAVLLRPTAFIMALLHCVLGLWWLLVGIAEWNLTVEPLILVILGLLAADVGLTRRAGTDVTIGGFLIAAFAQLQFLALVDISDWTVAIPASLTAAGAALGAMILLGRPSSVGWVQRRYALEEAEVRRLVPVSLHHLADFWTAVSVLACLFFCGPAALVLSVAILAVVLMSRIELQDRRELRNALSLRLMLVLLLQIGLLAVDPSQTVIPLALVTHGFDLLPVMAAAVLGWRLLGRASGRQEALGAWSVVVESALGLFIVAAALAGPELSVLSHVGVVAVAVGLAGLRIAGGAIGPRILHSWMTQLWIGIAILHGFTAGWLELNGAAAPWVLLLVAIAEFGLAEAFARTTLGPVFSPTCRLIGLVLPLAASMVAMVRMVAGDGSSVWVASLPAFAVSLFYAVVALRQGRAAGPGVAASAIFGLTLFIVVAQSGLGFEYTFLAPGLSLMALSSFLRPRIGATWSSYLTTAGAACLYATPIVALSEQVSWMWLAVLLVMTVAMGTICIARRSRSLLVVSTAAMLTDLGFFVFKIGTTEPLLLWVFGLGFGLALMAWAGYLEYQREGLLQQFRVFGRELRSWT